MQAGLPRCAHILQVLCMMGGDLSRIISSLNAACSCNNARFRKPMGMAPPRDSGQRLVHAMPSSLLTSMADCLPRVWSWDGW